MLRVTRQHVNETASTANMLLFNPFFRTLLSYLLDAPLFDLYMYGPALGGYGFNEGRELPVICAEITGVPERHWMELPDACEALIMRKFNALVVTLHFTVYTILLLCIMWSICGCAIFICCCRSRRPVITTTPRPEPCCRCAFRRSYSNLVMATRKPPTAPHNRSTTLT